MTSAEPTQIRVDVLIFGGGIAGLWTLARLKKEGYSCLLLESIALGAGQTIASQGIIHGGIKYALGGQASAASRAIAEMPGIWRACLRGEGEVDLRGVTVLSEHQYLWAAPGLLGRIGGFAASASMRAGVERVGAGQRPELLRDAADVYRADEPVLETRSVVRAMMEAVGERCRVVGDVRYMARADGTDAGPAGVRVWAGEREVEVRAGAIVLTAGEGNRGLMEGSGLTFPVRQQERALHMVMVRGAPEALYAHCVSASTTPRLTITSARLGAEWVWYIGGKIAEEGVPRSREEQIGVARAELRACLPGVGSAAMGRMRFATLRINRAEGIAAETPSGAGGTATRPDTPTVARAGNVIVGWPTKLAFAPLLAREVLAEVRGLGVSAREGTSEPEFPGARAGAARYPWEASVREAAKCVVESEVEWT